MELDRYEPDLHALFDAPVIEQVELDPGFEDHGSSVFRVRTANEDVVARSFRAADIHGPFWGCLHALFGIDPLTAAEAVPIYRLLSDVSPIAVPQVVRVAEMHGRPWLVVDLMHGTPLRGFDELSDAGLHDFGRALATIHARRFHTLGNPSGSMRYPPADFPRRLSHVLREWDRSHPDGPLPAALAADMRAAVDQLPPPTEGALVLPDMFAPQFLEQDGRITAIVDVDAYVVGPRELDLVGLEYFVDARTAPLIARGYREIAPLPPLRRVRRAYRYLLWVLTMNPMALDVHRWTAWPEAFA
jgi:aminoglycoside phosphotransferase (APT) family kinase protein